MPVNVSRMTVRLMAFAALALLTHFGPAWGQDLKQLEEQFRAAMNAGHYQEAERLARQGLAAASASQKPLTIAYWSTKLGLTLATLGRYVEAEPFFRRALAIYEKAFGPNHPDVAASLHNLATLYTEQGRYAEAEPLYRRALGINEKALGPDHPDVADNLNNLAALYKDQGRYAEAEPLYKRALVIREKAFGPDHRDVAQSLNNLADLYSAQGRYAEAEPLHRRALAIREKALRADHPDVAASLHNLATLYTEQGRYAEAEPLHKRALAIKEKALGPDHPDVADNLNNLANLYSDQGRYAEAEPLHRRSLAIREKALGADHPNVAASLNNLAILYVAQGRYAEAEPLHRRSLAIREKALGPDHPDVATSLNNLAILYINQGRYAEAEPLHKRSLAIVEKALGPGHPDVAGSLNNLAALYSDQGRYAEAEPLYRRSLAIKEKALGPDHPDVTYAIEGLARMELALGRRDEAERSIDRAIGIADRAGISPGRRYGMYLFRANLAWQAGRRDEALDDLREAIRLAEEQRGRASGAGRERAASFEGFAEGFERMVAWQAELGHPAEALAAIERSRARSLRDEILTAGVDLQAGRSLAERTELERKGATLREEIARLEKQLEQAGKGAESDRLRDGLAEARRRLYEHERDADADSPVSRELLNRGAGPPRLSQLQRRLCGDGGLILAYLFGQDGGYVVAVGPDRVRIETLRLDDGQAKALGVDPGPLTADRLRAVLLGTPGKARGVVPALAAPSAVDLTPKLAALYRVLVPESERSALAEGKVRRLIVAPDGPLAFLPFEALVVEGGEDPKYLLDVGPAVVYAPSATILLGLVDRRGAVGDREPVLTLGDPAYPVAGPAPAAGPAPEMLASRSRYTRAGGALPRLPYSAWETQWVAKAFADVGLKSLVLTASSATESAVRSRASGRRILHLACHGLADQELGNFYGSLALTPGPRSASDPVDDGFLTLPEIYTLDLKGCELVILSACQTNLGPQQRGEGTWALSRGFLVAGARRVVASNWLVDDEAAASLVSVFCTGLASAEKKGESADYSGSLREAKRWVRKQEKWKAPYYWASLVLVGPS
jgi:tetratricopeptide (TPR) repeat protein/CHAT domain-containing protein